MIEFSKKKTFKSLKKNFHQILEAFPSEKGLSEENF